MPRKPRFRPAITRVKLNPEQAVLLCSCYDVGSSGDGAAFERGTWICSASKTKAEVCAAGPESEATS